jgi:hypothetical protein
MIPCRGLFFPVWLHPLSSGQLNGSAGRACRFVFTKVVSRRPKCLLAEQDFFRICRENEGNAPL